MKPRRIGAIAVLLAGMVGLPASSAHALSCAPPDPAWLPFRQMIDQETTGRDDFDRMIIGKIIRIRDRGDAGGTATAFVRVAAHPTGYVPDAARVRIYVEPPGVSSGGWDFHEGQRWVFIAYRADGGAYHYDGDCGQTQPFGVSGYRHLVAYARAHD